MLAVEIYRREGGNCNFIINLSNYSPGIKHTTTNSFLMINYHRTFHDVPGSLHHSLLYITTKLSSLTPMTSPHYARVIQSDTEWHFLPVTVWLFKLYLRFLSSHPSLGFLFLLLFAPPLLDNGVGSLEILQNRGASSHHGGDDDPHDDVSQDRSASAEKQVRTSQVTQCLCRREERQERHFPLIYFMFWYFSLQEEE